MKKIILIFLINSMMAFGQNDNEILTKQKVLSKTYQTKAEWFLQIPQFNYDSSYHYYNKAIKSLNPNEPKHYEALSTIYFSMFKRLHLMYNSPKIDSCLKIARFYFDKNAEKSDKTNILEYDILVAEAKLSFIQNNQTKANEQMVKAFTLVQDDKSIDTRASFLFDKGYLFSKTKAQVLNDALKLSYQYLLQSKNLYEASKDPEKYPKLGQVYSRLSWHHNLYGTVDSCDYYYEKQKALLPLIKNPYVSANYLSLRANNYLRRKQYEKAIPLLKECSELLEKYKITHNEVYVFNTYLTGVREIESKNYDNAILLFKKGFEVSKSLNNRLFMKDGYEHISNAYAEKGDYKTAMKYQAEFHNSENSEYDKTLNKSLKEAELKLNIAKKDNEIAQKAKERNWYIGALIAGLFLLALVYRNFRLKQKSNKQLELLNGELATKNSLLDKRNAENELLLKEIHHRVKNNLEVVSSLLALQSAKIDDPEIQDAMLASQNRVQSMGILHQKLYQSEHLAFIEMKNYFQNLCENILDSYNETERIKVDIDMKEVELDVDTAVPVGLIVNELLTNSLKYAFPNGKKGNIKLSLENLDKDNLNLKISDNGIGKSLNMKAKGTGFGTQLVDLLTRQIDGKLVQEIHNGTIISINFKRQMAA